MSNSVQELQIGGRQSLIGACIYTTTLETLLFVQVCSLFFPCFPKDCVSRRIVFPVSCYRAENPKSLK